MSKYFTGSKDFYGNFQPAYFDTQYMGRAKYALDENKTAFNLKSLCEYESVDLIDAHRAMADTESTLELFKKYISALRNGQSGQLFNPRKDFKFQI
jgi:DNA polymerase III alpha subunit (gram-positive type)